AASAPSSCARSFPTRRSSERGIMAAKRTAELIPLCHPIALTKIDLDLTIDESRNAIDIRATARTRGRTGVEMEALTAVTVAALTDRKSTRLNSSHVKISYPVF